MPFDTALSPDQDVEALWKSFADYICKPYQNPEQQEYLRSWCADLYARKDLEGIELSYRRLTSPTGHVFDVFCLNDQMYFSHDDNIRDLAHPKDNEQISHADRLIGVWLHDMTLLKDNEWKNKFEAGLSKIKPGQAFWSATYHGPIGHTITQAMKANVSPGDNMSTRWSWWTSWRLRVARQDPNGSGFHRDAVPGISRNVKWFRSVIHVLHGTGTLFCIGRNENIQVMSPVGTTTFHYGEICELPELYAEKRGARHAALGCPEGRAVLFRETRGVPVKSTPPNSWRVEILPAPAFT